MNLMSIFLGLASLAFAVHVWKVKGCPVCSTAGLGACGAALACQLLELERLAAVGDVSAIYDTVHARSLAAMALLILNLALHTAALVRGRKKCGSCR